MADVNSTATELRLLACGPLSVDSQGPTATVGPAIMFKTRGHPLARSHGDCGVSFVGTKAELQAAGFGVGAVFPGEPGGSKKKTVLPACNGFSRVEVALYGDCQYLGEPHQTALQNYAVSARYLADSRNEKRIFEPTAWPGISLHHDTWYDVYIGSMNALIAAKLAAGWQFPGQLGCGKVRTTFSRDGKRVTAGSNTASQEGNRTVLVSGKQFEIWVRVSDADHDMRRARWIADFDARCDRAAQDVAALFLHHQAQPTKRHLRLVWSA